MVNRMRWGVKDKGGEERDQMVERGKSRIEKKQRKERKEKKTGEKN